MRVAVTGAGGFVGRFLCQHWPQQGLELVPLDRRQLDLAAPFALEPLLEGVDVVVHAAARAHVLRESQADPLQAFRRINVAGTRRLAEQAARAGVRRLVLISSIGVLGNHTHGRSAFTAADLPAPQEPYALSKWEGEQAARAVAEATGLELVVVRPPLVMGPGVKGNLLRLLRLAASGVPLPLAAVRNRRSFVGLTNLASLLRHLLEHPAAAGGCFLAADAEALSTPELLRRLRQGLGCSPRLWALPPAWLSAAGRVLGQGDAVQRLLGSLEVDASATSLRLGWQPPRSLDQELAAMVAWYRQVHR